METRITFDKKKYKNLEKDKKDLASDALIKIAETIKKMPMEGIIIEDFSENDEVVIRIKTKQYKKKKHVICLFDKKIKGYSPKIGDEIKGIGQYVSLGFINGQPRLGFEFLSLGNIHDNKVK